MCGWSDPEATAVYHEDDNWIAHLFVQPKDTLMEIWEGRRPGVEGALNDWPVDRASPSDELVQHLEERLEKAVRVHLRTGINTAIDSVVRSAVEKRDRKRQHFGSGPISIEDPSRRIAEMRLRKSEEEIEQMRYAAEVSSKAHDWQWRRAKREFMNSRFNRSSRASLFTVEQVVGRTLPLLDVVKMQPFCIIL